MNLTPVIQSIADEVGCSTTYVEIMFRDLGEDGGYTWYVTVEGVPGRRPAIQAKSSDLDAGVQDLMQKVGFWKKTRHL